MTQFEGYFDSAKLGAFLERGILTVSQGNRSMHTRESYRSGDVWQSPIITVSVALWTIGHTDF